MWTSLNTRMVIVGKAPRALNGWSSSWRLWGPHQSRYSCSWCCREWGGVIRNTADCDTVSKQGTTLWFACVLGCIHMLPYIPNWDRPNVDSRSLRHQARKTLGGTQPQKRCIIFRTISKSEWVEGHPLGHPCPKVSESGGGAGVPDFEGSPLIKKRVINIISEITNLIKHISRWHWPRKITVVHILAPPSWNCLVETLSSYPAIQLSSYV